MSEKDKTSSPPATTKNVDTKEQVVKKEVKKEVKNEEKEVKNEAPSITPTQKPTVKRKRKSEKEDNAIKYCLCREPERPGMIGCDFCEEWYHSSCLNLKKEDVKQLTKCKWKCPKCELTDSKQAKAQEKTNNDNIPENIPDNSSTSSEESSGRKLR